MRKAVINGKLCSSIEDFYSIKVPKIRYSKTEKPILKVADFYDEFLVKGNRLPKKEVVEEWHDLLIWYLGQPDATFFVRKYESGKENSEWNNRRGAVIRFNDGFEIVYASNFLAHEIFLMAYHGFVPDKDDFKTLIKNRKLHITSGTKVEKEIRLYPSANKVLTYCYLAHIMDVNGQYIRDNGDNKKLSTMEENRIFPRGIAENWTLSPDKIWHVPRILSASDKELVKAHCLRFLDPMNYYLTPLTTQSIHSVCELKKNIGEYSNLTYYVQQQYRKKYGNRYDDLIENGKFMEDQPFGYTGQEIINLEYSSQKNVFRKQKNPILAAAGIVNILPQKKNGNISRASEENKLKVAAYFLRNKDSLRSIEEKLFNCKSNGSRAKYILDSLGVSSDKKGLLIKSDIDTEIIKATGKFEQTLEEIKKGNL